MSTRVLVVDDERSLAKVVASYLRRDGHEVTRVFNGQAALESARRRPPDVIVLDLGLPGLDGLEVCRQLRTFSDCYVVMLTARTDAAILSCCCGTATPPDGRTWPRAARWRPS